jgi:hypothetical protein
LGNLPTNNSLKSLNMQGKGILYPDDKKDIECLKHGKVPRYP